MLSKDLNAMFNNLFVKPHKTLKLIREIALKNDEDCKLIREHYNLKNFRIYNDLFEFMEKTEIRLNDELDSIVISQVYKKNKLIFILPIKYIELSKSDLYREMIYDIKGKNIPLI